jgi:hypothetical protein
MKRSRESFGIYIKVDIEAHAEISDADINDDGTCASLAAVADTMYDAGWDFETPAGNPRGRKSRTTSARISGRVCCECGKCPDKKAPSK